MTTVTKYKMWLIKPGLKEPLVSCFKLQISKTWHINDFDLPFYMFCFLFLYEIYTKYDYYYLYTMSIVFCVYCFGDMNMNYLIKM